MEITKETQISQKQKRTGIKSCIIESWKVFALNTKVFFKYLWLHLFIAGLGYAIFSFIGCNFYTKHILSANAYVASGYDASLSKALFAPGVSDYLILGVAFLAFIFANYLMLGACFSQIRFYKATDSLPVASPFTFWGEIRKDGKKTFIYDLIIIVTVSLCTAVITLISWATSWWVMLLLIPILIYWTVIGTNGRLQYVVENKSLKVALKNAFKVGHHKFGGYLILLILTGIPTALMAYIAMLPGTIIQLAFEADQLSQLAGDPSGVPPYVLILYVLLATFGYALLSIAYTLQQWPLALYTSAVAGSQQESK